VTKPELTPASVHAEKIKALQTELEAVRKNARLKVRNIQARISEAKRFEREANIEAELKAEREKSRALQQQLDATKTSRPPVHTAQSVRPSGPPVSA
jgi:DNA repair exonuclease SbcCD ATPase subunit